MVSEGLRSTKAKPATARIVLASLVGTTIEFYDFYIYGTAAALVVGSTFFPGSDPALQALSAFLTFGIAFLARPVGSVLFGHFGDRVGRKSTLVGSMLVMGIATTLIGALPSYAQAGVLAPILLCLLRLFQGIGLGGEWGGAALIATENAPKRQRAWFGMFPQLGPPLGFLMANGFFLALLYGLGETEFLRFGWRIPFLFSAVLVAVGLYVRVSLAETPAFVAAAEQGDRARVPVWDVLRHHAVPLLQGSLAMVVCYALFYISTVFALGYGTGVGHIPKLQFLGLLCIAVLLMALATPISALLADMYGRRPVLLAGCAAAALSGLGLPRLLGSGDPGQTLIFLSMELALMGFTFAPMGALLPELFPTRVRYTGASTAYNLGGILGASLAPSIAQMLLQKGGLPWVGDYISVAALVSFLAVLSMKETRAATL